MTDPRDQIFGDVSQAVDERDREVSEELVAMRILRGLGCLRSAADVRKELGVKRFSLALLDQVVPDFPLRLAYTPTRYLSDVTVSQLLLPGGMFKTPLFRELVEAIDRYGWDDSEECVGIVTKWPHATTVVLHDLPRSEESLDRHKGYGRIVAVTSKGGQPAVYSLESLDSLVASLPRYQD